MVDSQRFFSRGIRRVVVGFAVVPMVIGCLATTALFATEGLVAHYPFDGDTNDASGWGNHAVAMGAVPTEDRFGNPGHAYLVASIGHLEAADSDSLDISDEVTISAWFRQDDMISTQAMIACKGYGTSFSAFVYYGGSLLCPDPAAERRFQVSVGGGTNGWVNGPYFDCATDEWHHVVVTIGTQPGGNHPADLYVDGVFIHTTSMAGDFTNNSAPLGIGANGGGSYRFVGAIDDFRLYDRVLSAQEAVDLYHAIFIDGFEAASTSFWSLTSP